MIFASAREYAESLAADIIERTNQGYPFGWKHSETGEWSGEAPAELDADDWEEATAYDWLDGVLDIQYGVSSDRTYRSARVCIAFGGPTAWIDTRTGTLEVAWWSAWEHVELPSEFIDGLDDALSELWGMGA